MKEKGGFWRNPWTRWLQREDPEALQSRLLNVWGPYRSSAYKFFHDAISKSMSDEYVLIASGSGFVYLLDACSFFEIKMHYRI